MLCNARARWLQADDYPFGFPIEGREEVMARVVDPDAAAKGPPPFDPAPSVAGDAAYQHWWQRAGHRRASPAMAPAVIKERTFLDLRDSLPLIRVPKRWGSTSEPASTGEVEIIGDDIAGMGVHIAARVQSAASPGEVWVSRTVADLVTGSGIIFQERGEHELKGVPGRWALYAPNP